MCEGLPLPKLISIHPESLEMAQPCPRPWWGPGGRGVPGLHCPDQHSSARAALELPCATSPRQVLQVMEQNGSCAFGKGAQPLSSCQEGPGGAGIAEIPVEIGFREYLCKSHLLQGY